MVVVTVAVLVVPLLAGAGFGPSLLRTMTSMVVASPCAVVLATTPLLASIANAGRHGVLVKSAVVMEQLGTVSLAAFDKTGTLTEGAPHLLAVHPVPGSGWDGQAVLRVAAAAERVSEHPLAGAVVSAAQDAALPVPEATGSSHLPGRGVAATVEGRWPSVVSPSRFEVAALAALTGRPPLLPSGDADGAARALAAEVDLTRVHAALLPADKVEHIRAEQAAGARVVFVGDGVNDAPALAAAELGVALGGRGSDLALGDLLGVVVAVDPYVCPSDGATEGRC